MFQNPRARIQPGSWDKDKEFPSLSLALCPALTHPLPFLNGSSPSCHSFGKASFSITQSTYCKMPWCQASHPLSLRDQLLVQLDTASLNSGLPEKELQLANFQRVLNYILYLRIKWYWWNKCWWHSLTENFSFTNSLLSILNPTFMEIPPRPSLYVTHSFPWLIFFFSENCHHCQILKVVESPHWCFLHIEKLSD